MHSPLKSESGRGVPLKLFDFTLPYLSCSTFSVHHILSVSSAETSENYQNVTPFINMVAHNVVSTIEFVKMCPFIRPDYGQPAIVCYLPRPICVV